MCDAPRKAEFLRRRVRHVDFEEITRKFGKAIDMACFDDKFGRCEPIAR